MYKRWACVFVVLMASTMGVTSTRAGEGQHWKIHDPARPKPPVIDPAGFSTQDKPGQPPSDAIVLFDGSDVSDWRAMNGGPAKWIVRDGYMESVKGAGYVRTLRGFGDCQLHVEFMTPTPPKGSSQGRGNSGVFLMGKYEVQVLDSYANETYADGQAASVYGQYPPQVNACRPPGEWQTYDIIFKAPVFNEDKNLKKPAHITVIHNGVLVQDHVEILGPTNWCSRTPYSYHPGKLPLSLQDHGNPVRYRNIWVRELPSSGDANTYRPELILGEELLDKYVGTYDRGNGAMTKIIKKDGQLYPSFPGNPPYPIYAETETLFYSKFVNAEIEFIVKDGVVTGLKYKVADGGWGEAKKVD